MCCCLPDGRPVLAAMLWVDGGNLIFATLKPSSLFTDFRICPKNVKLRPSSVPVEDFI